MTNAPSLSELTLSGDVTGKALKFLDEMSIVCPSCLRLIDVGGLKVGEVKLKEASSELTVLGEGPNIKVTILT